MKDHLGFIFFVNFLFIEMLKIYKIICKFYPGKNIYKRIIFHVTGPTTTTPEETTTTTLSSTSKPTTTMSTESTTSTVDCTGFFPGYICSDRFPSIWFNKIISVQLGNSALPGKETFSVKVNLLIQSKNFTLVPKSKFEANRSH